MFLDLKLEVCQKYEYFSIALELHFLFLTIFIGFKMLNDTAWIQ